MNTYEGMFIFPEQLKDDELETVVGECKAVIEKEGGKVGSVIRLGKRAFAREMHKMKTGHYFVITFDADGTQIPQLRARFKLAENVFRVQFIRQEEPQVNAEEPVEAEAS